MLGEIQGQQRAIYRALHSSYMRVSLEMESKERDSDISNLWASMEAKFAISNEYQRDTYQRS